MGIKEKIKSIMNTKILPSIYRRAAKKPVEKGLVIMSDCHHNSCPPAMQYMRDRLLEHTEFTFEELYFDVADGMSKGFKAMKQFMKRYAVAEYVIICDNHLPVASCEKREETKVIQLWHGGGALKKFGYDSEINVPKDYKGGNVFANYDLVTVSAPNAVEPFTSAMRQPEGVVLPIGLPKTDFYHNEQYVEEIRTIFYTSHVEAAGKKLVLWAPTFRGSASDPELDGQEIVERLKKELGDEFYIIESFHPHAVKKSGIKARQLTSDELMCVVDIMISDYSSIIYDWIYQDKPLILFVPDKEKYIKENGFYLDYETIPGVQARDYDELKAALKNAKLDNNPGAREFYDEHMSACDGRASERVIQWMHNCAI